MRIWNFRTGAGHAKQNGGAAPAGDNWFSRRGSVLTDTEGLPTVSPTTNKAMLPNQVGSRQISLWFKDVAASGSSHGTLTETKPANAASTVGWVCGTATGYSPMTWNVYPQPSTSFGATALPNGPPGTNDCLRSDTQYTGSFAAGNWVLGLTLAADLASGATLAIRFRVWHSADPTGATGVTEITAGAVEGNSIVINSSGGLSTITASLGAATLSGEYLFLQIACHSIGPGGAGDDSEAYTGTTSGAEVITPLFTAGATSHSYTQNISESIGAVTDAVARLFVGARTVTEAIAVATDAVARQFIGTRALSESIGAPTDAVARVDHANRPIAESVAAPTDAVTRAFVGTRSNISENVAAPIDALTRAQILLRSLAESIIAPTDAVARILVHPRNISESIAAPTDAVTRATVTSRSVAESIGAPTDAVSRATLVLRTITETISAVTDAVARRIVAVRPIAESTAAPTDAVTRTTSAHRTVTESVAAPTDVVSRVLGANRTVTETISAVTDAVVRSAGLFFRTVGENFAAPTDAVTHFNPIGRAVSESIPAPLDAVARATNASRTLNENITAPTDSVTRNLPNTSRTVTESLALPSDVVGRVYAGVRTVVESIIAPTDLVARSRGMFRLITETVTAPVDTLLRVLAYTRLVFENIQAPTDAVTPPPPTSHIDITKPVFLFKIPPGVEVRLTTRPLYMPEILGIVPASPRFWKAQQLKLQGRLLANAAGRLIVQPPDKEYCYVLHNSDLLQLEARLPAYAIVNTITSTFIWVATVIT